MTDVEFTVLSYYPSLVNEENINVGLLFFSKDYRFFYILRNTKRLGSFDDELDIEFMKDYLAGIKSGWETGNCGVAEFTYNYGNELRFSAIRHASVENIDEFVQETIKMNFRFDFPVKERPGSESIKRYLKDLLRNSGIKFSSHAVQGSFGEKINYDFIVNNTGFKSFVVDENTVVNQQINNYKGWALTAELNKSKGVSSVFILDSDRADDSFRVVKNILSSYGTVIKSSDALNYINNSL